MKSGELKVVAEIFRVVSFENRLKIIKELSSGRKTWSELMFALKMNPKILDESLKKLIRAGVVVKEGNKYRLTGIGNYILQIIENLTSNSS